jgi:hypothetical protein
MNNKELGNKNAIFEALEALKVVKVLVTWNGGGDSGGIESIEASDKAGKEVKLDVPFTLGGKLNEVIENFCMDWVDNKGSAGWYNNEGGYGEATFNVEDRTISIDHSNFEQVSHSIGAEEL